MSGKFTPEQDERLIDLVRLNPLLFSMKKRGHKDTQIRSSIWQLIATNIGKTEKECKVRWKIMRDYYQRRKKEANKTDCMITFGGKLSSLTFLDSITSKKRNASSTPAQQRLESPANQPTAVTQPTFISQPTIVSQPSSVSQPASLSQPSSFSQPTTLSQSTAATTPAFVTQRIYIKTRPAVETRQETLTPKVEQPSLQPNKAENLAQPSNGPERKRKKSASLKKKMYREIVESRNERLEILRRLSQQPDELLNNDPNSLFFQSIKATIDRFPVHLQSQAKLKILQVVSDLELQSVQEISLTEYSNYPAASAPQSFFTEDSTNQLHAEQLQIPADMTPNFSKLNGSPK